jgi:hypothetical protein
MNAFKERHVDERSPTWLENADNLMGDIPWLLDVLQYCVAPDVIKGVVVKRQIVSVRDNVHTVNFNVVEVIASSLIL